MSDDFAGNCSSTLNCFVNVFDFTFKANGGIGGYLEEINPRKPGQVRIDRFFFDNLANIILVVIMVNIVSGSQFRDLYKSDRYYYRYIC